jgi:predicted Zn-dependent protease
MNRIAIIFCSLVSLMFSHFVQAEQKVVKSNWDIHYIAFQSTFLEPEIASAYQLQRSKYMAVVNISVLNNLENMKAQRVALKGSAKNLLGQTKTLTFKQVTEGDAIYYLAQVEFRNEEILNFNINVRQGDRVETLTFKQKLYVD